MPDEEAGLFGKLELLDHFAVDVFDGLEKVRLAASVPQVRGWMKADYVDAEFRRRGSSITIVNELSTVQKLERDTRVPIERPRLDCRNPR